MRWQNILLLLVTLALVLAWARSQVLWLADSPEGQAPATVQSATLLAEPSAEPPAGPSLDSATLPNPHLSPQAVVMAQLEALQTNDAPQPDAGIRAAWAFASPDNRKNTGPLEHFTEIVRSPAYRSLINHRMHGLDPIEQRADVARQKVTLIDAQGRPAVYFFLLSRQTASPYEGCWMTDAVYRGEG